MEKEKTMKNVFGLLVAVVLFVTVAHASSGTIAINQAPVHFGDSVTFSWSCDGCAKSPKSAPRIQVLCYQDGFLVYGEAGPADNVFMLGGAMSDWVVNGGGPAACKADLYFWSYKGQQEFNFVATTAFNAE
jgi:hypothetical protein